MKKLLFLFCIVLSFVSTGYGQNIMIGARGGLNFASEHYESLPSDQTISERILDFGGVQLDYFFNNSIALSLQALYLRKGAHGEAYEGAFGPPGMSNHADWTISYLEIPLLAKLNLGSETDRLYFFAGPSIGFLLKNMEIVSSMSNFHYGVAPISPNYYLDTTADISDSTAKLELSIIAGVGYSFVLHSGTQLFLDLSYSFGLTNIDNYSADKANDAYIYSRDIRIAAGVMFPLN